MKYRDKQSTKPGTVDARQVADVFRLTNTAAQTYRIKFTDATHNDVEVGSIYWPHGRQPITLGDWFVTGAFGGYMTDKAFHDRYEPVPDTANRYVSHKEVTAYEFVSYAPLMGGGYQVTLRDHVPVDCEDAMFTRYHPESGDFLVIYADGYKSFSPRASFLEGYKPKTNGVAGLPVAGYAPTQSEKNLALVNENKRAEERMLRTLDALVSIPDVDKRWLAIGRTQLEQAFMAINRAIFKPGRVDIKD